MAESSTQFGCNDLAKNVSGCEENGNIRLINPNAQIDEEGVKNEDLVMYATLRARVKNKSLLVDKDDELWNELTFIKAKSNAPGQAAEGSVNATPENTSFLTTNWTNIGSSDMLFETDHETFGITNINIDIQADFIPKISIDFVDLRGATLFEQGSCSPYASFFHQPYPVFELVLKGYYGSPIKYQLMVKDFRTTFDASTGNYVSKAEMVGFNYAFLGDIMLAYVLAVPYIEGADEILTSIYEDYLKYYDERGFNQGKNKFEPLSADDNSPLTLYNYVRKLQELEGQGNSDKGAIAEIQNSSELFTIENLDKFQDIISDVNKLLDRDFDEDWKKEGGQQSNDLYYYGDSSGGDTGVVTNKVLDVYNKYFSNVGLISTKISTYNDLVQESNSEFLTPITSGYEITRGGSYLISLDLSSLNTELDNKLNELSSDLKKQRKEFIALANAKIKSSVGFVPTIRSFFTTLIGNTELFLELLRNASYDAEEYHQRNSDSDKIRFKNEEDVPVSDIVYAWPTYTEIRQSGTRDESEVEVYPGVNPKFQNWPEVIFVEKLIKALTEMNRKLQEGEDEEVNPNIDPYDGIPGRDNYFPVNAMETPLGARDANNSYYNLNSKDAVIRTLGERFILYSNVTGVNSNFLNTSVIASAKNGFNQTLLSRGSFAVKPVEFGLNTPFKPYQEKYQVFPGIEKLEDCTLTPYFSSGHPFNPKKWGGEDVDSGVNVSLSNQPLRITGIKGYPFIDDRAFKNYKFPMGFDPNKAPGRLSEWNNSDGEISSLNNQTLDTITSVQELREHIITFKTPTDSLPNIKNLSEWVDNIQYKGNLNETKSFPSDNNIVILEPVYFTKKMVIIFVDKDTTKEGYNVEKHISQIPQNVRDKSWIILCSNYVFYDYTKKNKKSRAEYLTGIINTNNFTTLVDDIIKRFYGIIGNPNTKSGVNPINIVDNGLTDFEITLIGYGSGSFEAFISSYYEDFPDSLFNTLKLDTIGLVDPNLFGLSGNSYSDLEKSVITRDGVFNRVQDFTTLTIDNLIKENVDSKFKMLWGSKSQINVFGGEYTPNNYQSLEDSIKEQAGQSVKISDLNRSQALKLWFDNYGENIISSVSESDKFIYTNINRLKQEAKNKDKVNDVTNITNENNNWGTLELNERNQDNWEYLGGLEAHNMFNSLSNQNLIGNILSSTDNVKKLYDEIIKLLGISSSDIYEDTNNSLYRYDKPIVINRVSKENGGPIKVLPNIHNMKGSDLVRLTRFDNIEENGWSFSSKENKSFSPVYYWYQNASGRRGFEIDEDSTFLTSSIFEYLKKYYGSEPKGKNTLVLSDNSNSFVDVGLSRDFNLKTGKQTLMHLNSKGMSRTGLFNTEGTFLTNASRASIDGSVDLLGNAMANQFSQTNPVLKDKLLNFDSWPNNVFNYYNLKSTLAYKGKYGGEFTRKYILDTSLLSVPAQAEANTNYYLGIDEKSYQGMTWNTLDFNTPLYAKYNKESAILYRTPSTVSGKFMSDASNTTGGAYSESVLSYGNWSTNSFNKTSNGIKEWVNKYGSGQTLKVVSGLGLNESLTPFTDASLDKYRNFEAPDDPLQNSNFINQGATITETPWWRHNFPSNESGSETPKRYYSFYGAGFFNEIEGENLSNQSSDGEYLRQPSQMNLSKVDKDNKKGQSKYISKKPLLMGLANDLDSYQTTSKFFPSGNGATENYFGEKNSVSNIYRGGQEVSKNSKSPYAIENYYGSSLNWTVKRNSKNQPQGRKYQLTNHNKDDFNLSRNSVTASDLAETISYVYAKDISFGNLTVDSTLTSYNKTKAWKGALAYLFLSNQYHKPWTGLYTNNNKNFGPQGYLGMSSFNAQMPRHSVLILGAVLWRMRESGLLESDDNKWNLPSQITNGLDPVNYPMAPDKVELKLKNQRSYSQVFDLKNFIFTRTNNQINGSLDDSSIDIGPTQLNPEGSVWPSNHNVRPPLISLISYPGSNPTFTHKFMTFPRADEWPAPNLGMIGAYDFFAEKKAKNPFKNQYRIFTPILANSGMNALRYNSQNVRFLNTEEQLKNFKDKIKTRAENAIEEVQEWGKEASEAKVQNAKAGGDANPDEAAVAVQKTAEETIGDIAKVAEEVLKRELSGTTIDNLLKKEKFLAGTEESFTRLTSLVYTWQEFSNGALIHSRGHDKQTNDSTTEVQELDEIPDYLQVGGAVDFIGHDGFQFENMDLFQLSDGRSSLFQPIADGENPTLGKVIGDVVTAENVTNLDLTTINIESVSTNKNVDILINNPKEFKELINNKKAKLNKLYKIIDSPSSTSKTVKVDGKIFHVENNDQGGKVTVNVGSVLKELVDTSQIKNWNYRAIKGEDVEFDLYKGGGSGRPLKPGEIDSTSRPNQKMVNGEAVSFIQKTWKVKRGPLNITLDNQGNFTQIVPQELETTGGYKPTVGSKKITDDFESSRYQSKRKQYTNDFFGNNSIGDRSLEAQKLIKKGGTVEDLNTDDNTYKRFIGFYKIFADRSFVVYNGGEVQEKDVNFDFEPPKITTEIGRLFQIALSNTTPKQLIEIGLIKPTDTDTNSDDESSDAQLLEKKILIQKDLTLKNDPEVDQEEYTRSYLRTLQRRTAYYGYLRGYLPLGPEIWFMPTEVKKIFIKEFEDYVGDMNNWVNPEGTTDNFDYVLQTIDPLNFPSYKNNNKFEVFKNEIIIPTAFEEIGTVGTDAPSILRLTNDGLRGTLNRDNDLNLDKNNLPKTPQSLLEFASLFSLVPAQEPLRTLREESTKDTRAYNLKTLNGDPETDWKYIAQTTNAKNPKLDNIYKSLFGSYYFVTSTTPRTFWGEFPLQEIDGEMVETTHDYFNFNQQELRKFVTGFVKQMSSPEIAQKFEDGIKAAYLDELNGEVLGAGQDDDIRLSIYRSLKTLYDKYISGSAAGKTNGQGEDKTRMFYNPIGKNRLFIDHFVFLNRVNADIGDAALVKLETVNNLFQNTQNSIFEVSSDVLSSSNFLFLPLPGYVDLSAGLTKEAVDRNTEYPNFAAEQANNMFRPISDQGTFSDIDSKLGSPMWYSMYIGGVSRQLKLKNDDNQPGCLTELNINGKKEQSDDGFLLSPSPSSKPAPPDFTSTSTPDNSLTNSNSTSKGITAFKVRFGAQNQSHFTGINLDQLEFKDTNESIVATENIARRAADGGAGGFIAKGQDLYQIFLNRSYTAKVESMGNAMIQPFQYFQLENVPMFFGSYLITKVSHNVRPNHMKTSFEGVRMSHATVPVVEDFISTFNIKPSKEGAKRKSLKGTGGNSNKASGGGSSSSSSSTTGAKSVSGLYYPIEIATTNVTDEKGNTKNITKKIREGLVARGFNLKQILTSNSKYKGRALKDGTFYNETQTVNAPAKGNPVQYPKYSGTDERGPKGIQIHWTAGYTAKSAINTLGSKGLAYSILIGEDGPAYQISNLERSTYHAGCTSKCPRCKGGMNQKALGISYVGGIEAGSKVSRNAGYLRTWEDWQTEEKIVPWCPNGTIWNSEGITSCSDKEVTSGKHKPSAKGEVFRPKDQWESLVDSILMMKVKYPRMQWLTGHNFTCSGKSDPGLGFPWDKLIRDLKARGWNETDADDDPFVVTEWPNDNPGGPESKGDTSKGIVETQKKRFDEVIAEFETAGIENGAEANEYDMDDVLITQQESANDAEAGQTVDELGCRILNGPFKYGPNNTGKGLIKDLGLTKEQAAGVVGNLTAESGLVPDRIQGSGTKTGLISEAVNKNNESLGYGWAQWTFPKLKEDFIESAEAVGVDLTKTPADIDINYKYLVEFIQANGNLTINKTKYGNIATELGIDKCGGSEGLKKTKTVREATVYFLGCYERAEVQDEKEILKRTNFANEIYQTCESSNVTTQNDDTETVVENGVIVHSNVKNLNEALGIEGPYTANYPPPAAATDNDASPGIPQSVIDDLVLLNVEYINYNGEECRGQIVTFKKGEEAMKKVFKKLKEIGYPIERCDLPVKYNWNDEKMMKKNITNGFNYRVITGGSNISPHGNRPTLDLNPLWNPYISPAYINDDKSQGLSSGPYKELTPPNTPYKTVESWFKNEPDPTLALEAVRGASFNSSNGAVKASKMNVIDKSWIPNNEEITITGDNAVGKKSKVVQAFKESGFNRWGGLWKSEIDGQHFEITPYNNTNL